MPPSEITTLLRAWGDGDEAARDAVWPELYGELKVLARSILRRKGRGRPTTELVNEAALRLLNAEVSWNDRRHFFAVAARAMRFVLVDEVRRKLAGMREGERGAIELPDEVADPMARRPEEVLSVHRALERLARINPRQQQLVELRYFAGMSNAEAADVLGVSTPTVVRDWRAVRVWLHGELRSMAES